MPWIPLRGPWHPTKFPESIKCRWGSVSYKVWLSNQRPCWGGRWGRSTCQHGERTYELSVCRRALLPRLRLGVCHLTDPHKHQEYLVGVRERRTCLYCCKPFPFKMKRRRRSCASQRDVENTVTYKLLVSIKPSSTYESTYLPDQKPTIFSSQDSHRR